MVRVGIAAKSVPEKFETIANGGNPRRGGDLFRSRGNIRRRKNGADDPPAASRDTGENCPRIERRDEQRAPGRVGGDLVSVGERDVYTRRQAAGDVQNSERGAFAGNQ